MFGYPRSRLAKTDALRNSERNGFSLYYITFSITQYDVVRMCSEEEIPIHFISKRGSTLAGLYATGLKVAEKMLERLDGSKACRQIRQVLMACSMLPQSWPICT